MTKMFRPIFTVDKIIKLKASTILSVIAGAGVIATGVLSAIATPKAMDDLKKARKKKTEKLSKAEEIFVVGKNYIPAALVAGTTIMCIASADILNKKQQASLMGAYALADRSFKEYRKSLIELHGEEADKEVTDNIARRCYKYHFINDDIPDEKVYFYEPYSKTILHRYEREIIDAEYHFNRNFSMAGYATLNDWFLMLGLPTTDYGDALGWYTCDAYVWVDFEHDRVDNADGTYVVSINPYYDPDTQWQEEWGGPYIDDPHEFG